MIKLLKLEWQRKWKMSLSILAMYMLVFLGFLFKFKNDIGDKISGMNLSNLDLEILINEFGFKFLFFIFLGSALFFVSMIGAINNLRLEAKQPSRDLYFSIPMTAYTKIGSKVIVSLIEMGAAILIAVVSTVKAFEFLTKLEVGEKIMDWITALPTDALIYLTLYQIIYSALMIIVVYLSFAIFRSFFSQVKFGGFITFIIYVVLMYILIKIFGGVMTSLDNTSMTDTTAWLILFVFGLFTSGVFALTGFLFEKRVSFD